MNNQTIRELRAIAKERGLRGYYKLLKAELVALLETPVRPPRRPGKRKDLGRAAIYQSLRKWMFLSNTR